MKNYQRRTPQQWQLLLIQQQESGLSAPQFCQQSDIAYATFCHWRKRLTESDPDATPIEPAFIELNTATAAQPPETQWAVELELCDGMVLRIARN